MAGRSIRGPNVKVIDQPLKNVHEFEQWRHSMVFYLRQDEEFKQYLKPDLEFGKKTGSKPYRNCVTDSGDNPKSAEYKCEIIDFLLETIAQYVPLIPQADILNCGSLVEVWQVIRLHSNIEPSGALLNQVWNTVRQPGESPQALWSRLKQQYDDCLLRPKGLFYTDKQVTAAEVMSPTLHNVIILHWLQIIHPKLRDLVTQRFSKELRNATYASIWPEISKSIDGFLSELSNEDSCIRSFDEDLYIRRFDPGGASATRFPDKHFSRSSWRGRGSTQQRPRGNAPFRSQSTKSCDYCRLTGRRAYYTHNIEECNFLKRESPASSRAFDTLEDEHLAEFYAEYPEAELQPTSNQMNKIHIINRISTHPSPTLPVYYDNVLYYMTLDTGGTCSIIDKETAVICKCDIKPTDQGARMADGTSNLRVIGETELIFTRNHKSFSFNALVCDIPEPTLLAGMPFLAQHDIAIRPAKSEIVLDGSESILYDSKSVKPPVSRKLTNFTIRTPSSTVILPGESTTFQLPGYLKNEKSVAIEPRYDNKHQQHLSQPWPTPKVYEVKKGALKFENNTREPIMLKKNLHVCNVHTKVPDQEVAAITMSKADQSALYYPDKSPADDLEISSRNSSTGSTWKWNSIKASTCKPLKKVAPYSSPVKVDPDKQMPAEMVSKFRSLVETYDEVFNPTIGRYNQKAGKVEVEVNMGDSPPPQNKGRVPFYGRDSLVELQEKFDELINKGVFKRPQDIGITVENLNTTFLVKKRDSQDKRLVTDFASIVEYCRPTPGLMPDADSTLRQIATWRYLIHADFKESYFQIPLKKSSMRYCGVVTPMRGVYVYQVGCMGLPGTEVALEELTSLLFGHMVKEGCVAKLADDLFIGGNTLEELYNNFERVLKILHENNLKLNAKKTTIAPTSVIILGWLWSAGLLSGSPHKLLALAECEPPQTMKALKSYVGAYRFLSRVIKDYATVLLPLEKMIPGKYASKSGGNVKVTWTPERLQAFASAQSALRSAKSISLPHPDDVLQMITDAAITPSAIGATLYLIRGDKTLLGGFFNSKLPSFQRRWLPCELEGVAIGMTLSHFAPYILQSTQRPVILTDSKACVDAVGKLRKGQFSASARLTTFLSSVSRFNAVVKHIKGSSNVLSDYISRNPIECQDPRCQICSFIRHSMEAVVSSISVSDVLEGKVHLPFTNKQSWSEIQENCQDLRNVYKFLRHGTTPGKKGTNYRRVKQYIRAGAVISDGVLVIRQVEPFQPQTERIIVPNTVLHGILTVLHLKLEHPTKYQLMQVFNRYFYTLKLDATAAQTSKSCHQCVSLEDVPISLKKQSTEEVPDYITQKCAADVIKRNKQLILVLRETVSSYTQSTLLDNETVGCVSTGLLILANLLRPSSLTPMTIRVDPHSSHKSLFNSHESILSDNNIYLELGRALNPNKNPVAEKCVREMIGELLRLQPEGGPVSSHILSKATANLNSRIRAAGVSAHEMYTQRDQVTGKQLSIEDLEVIQNQHKRRLENHKYSEKSKSRGKPELPKPTVRVGSIVYLYAEGSKEKARPRYVVLEINGDMCKIRRFAEKQLGRITYTVMLSECYVVQMDETLECLPPYPEEDSDEEEYVLCPTTPHTTPTTPDSNDESDGNSSEESDSDLDSQSETEETSSNPEEEEMTVPDYCNLCHREVKEHHQSLVCDLCSKWSHRNCLKMTKQVYNQLTKEDTFNWQCPNCPVEEPVRVDEEIPPDI